MCVGSGKFCKGLGTWQDMGFLSYSQFSASATREPHSHPGEGVLGTPGPPRAPSSALGGAGYPQGHKEPLSCPRKGWVPQGHKSLSPVLWEGLAPQGHQKPSPCPRGAGSALGPPEAPLPVLKEWARYPQGHQAGSKFICCGTDSMDTHAVSAWPQVTCGPEG